MPRKISNLMVNSRLQGGYLGHAIGAFVLGCASMGLAVAIAYTVYFEKHVGTDTLLQMQLVKFVLSAGLPIIFGVCVGLGLIFVVPFSLLMSHRTAGPMIAIKKYLRAQQLGDYSAKLELRENDELKEIADDIKELAAKIPRDERLDDLLVDEKKVA